MLQPRVKRFILALMKECAPTAAPRGRPRSFDRDAALCVAMHLFWQRGYAGTSIGALCEAIGIAAPSLYAAFGSKELLYRAALERYIASRDGDIWASLDAAPTALAAIEAYLLDSARRFAAVGPQPGGCMVTAFGEAADDLPAIDSWIADLREDARTRLTARLARGLREGDLPAGTAPAALAQFVSTYQQGLAVRAREGASAEALVALAELGVRAVVRLLS